MVGGCIRDVRVGRESSFAGGGGGVAIMSGVDSPRGPRGSESRSKSSSFEITDWPRREPVGRRRDASGEERGAEVRGVDVDVVGFCSDVGRGGMRAVLVLDESNRPEDVAMDALDRL